MREHIDNTVLAVTVRAAGEVRSRVDITNVTGRNFALAIALDNILCHVTESRTLALIIETWQQVEPLVGALPETAPAGTRGLGAHPVCVSARIDGEPVITTALMPERPGACAPIHLRVQIGPVVWQVCDRTAYHVLRSTWENASGIIARATRAA